MRNALRMVLSLLAVLALGVTGCTGDGTDESVGVDDEGKFDAWDTTNDPRRFGNNFEYNWETLNTPELAQGASKIVPWPDTYWPMMEDGYNMRWNGSAMSPAELYDQAFNGWTPPEGFMELRRYERDGVAWDQEYYDAIGPTTTWAHDGGNKRARDIHNPDGTLVSSIDADGDGIVDRDLNGDGEVDHNDNEGGLAGWFGHCHAWAPASFFHPEPQHEVTVNDTTFTVSDIKAMIEATHEGCGGTLFLGGRCNLREIERDEYGRVVDAQQECRDTNAGSWHVVILNVMGINGGSFVADVTTDYQVWNHPGRDYTIRRQDEVTEAQALQLVNRSDVTEYPYNSQASRFVHVEMTFRYVVEGNASTSPFIPMIDSYTRTRDYEYLLELDADGNILGGEWISTNQPDFLWAPTQNCDARGSRWGGPVVVSRANVQTLIDQSTSTEPPPPVGDEQSYDSNIETPVAIPDNNENGASHTINVPDSHSIAGLRVNVDVTHTYRGDLTVELIRGENTVTLVANEGGGADDIVESFNVADFNGQDSAGAWTLRVVDSANIDTGTINSWRLTFITN